MNILFYTPVNFQCRDLASLILGLKKSGHNVILLSQVSKGSLHFFLEEKGIRTYTYFSEIKSNSIRLALQVLHLVHFCWKHKVNALFSHLEPTNIVSVISQYFLPSRVIIFRHHLDLAQLSNFDQSFTYRLTYKLARRIITVSSRSKDYMIMVEKISPKKIVHINLGYDFDLYPLVDTKKVASLKKKYDADILLVVLGRLDKFKRPEIAIDVLASLVSDYRVNAKLLFLGTGDLTNKLKKDVLNKNLQDLVFFTGFVENVLEYLSAANFLLHPSISESSSVAIKEAALVNLPVIACKNVGDFDDYLKNDINSFVLDQHAATSQASMAIFNNYNNKSKLQKMAAALRQEVITRFSIERTLPNYLRIISDI